MNLINNIVNKINHKKKHASSFTHNDKVCIQSLWIGNKLTLVEKLCIQSFIQNGHQFILYTYNNIDQVPDGTILADAAQILPKENIFKAHGGSYGAFSDWFRWELLCSKGGWWVDTDVICLAPFKFVDDIIFAKETDEKLGTAVLRFPADHAFCHIMRNRCRNLQKTDITSNESIESSMNKLRWGELGGPLALTEEALKSDLFKLAKSFWTFYPVHWQNALSVLNDKLLDEQINTVIKSSSAIHLWNEVLRRNNTDKDNINSLDNSLFLHLLKKYGI